jgi:hypothetical protein
MSLEHDQPNEGSFIAQNPLNTISQEELLRYRGKVLAVCMKGGGLIDVADSTEQVHQKMADQQREHGSYFTFAVPIL